MGKAGWLFCLMATYRMPCAGPAEMMTRALVLLIVAGLAVASSARADPPTSVLVTQTVQTLTAATDAALTGTGAGIRMLCVQNIGANPASLAFDVAAVAGS